MKQKINFYQIDVNSKVEIVYQQFHTGNILKLLQISISPLLQENFFLFTHWQYQFEKNIWFRFFTKHRKIENAVRIKKKTITFVS